MRKRIIQDNFTVNNVTGTSYSSVISLDDCAETISVQVVADVNTPSAVIVASAAITINTDPTHPSSFHSVAHGLIDGLKVQVSTSTTLPTGITAVTDYFVIKTDADYFKLATSLVNALAGTAQSITNVGVGNQTVTPTAIAGGTWTLQQSNDGTNYADVASATNVTTDASFFVEKIDPTSKQMRIKCVVTAGMFSCDNHVLVKGGQV